jgi:hypothetical protein
MASCERSRIVRAQGSAAGVPVEPQPLDFPSFALPGSRTVVDPDLCVSGPVTRACYRDAQVTTLTALQQATSVGFDTVAVEPTDQEDTAR